jgi:regulator of sigma D
MENYDRVGINQTMGNLYAISKVWYKIRDQNVDIVDMEKMFNDIVLKKGTFMELAREARNIMRQLEEKYTASEGLGSQS